MENAINYLGIALSLLGLGVVAPFAVRLWLTRVRNKLGWPKRPAPSLRIYGVSGWGHARLDYPDPTADDSARIVSLENTVRQLERNVIDIDQMLAGDITKVSNQVYASFAEADATASRLNAGGFVPVGLGIVCSGLAEDLSSWTPLAVAVVISASAALTYWAVWLWRWIARARRA